MGVWMDHAAAHLMDFDGDVVDQPTVASAFTRQVMEASLQKGERLMHNREKRNELAYFKQIMAVLKEYHKILLFGPTDAKMQLANLLKQDMHFNNKTVTVRDAGKLTEHQEHAYVRDFFSGKMGRFD